MNTPILETPQKSLKDTAWLAKRLNLSITTIERFRVKAPKLLPPAIKLGSSIRYDEETVEAWVKRKIGEEFNAQDQTSADNSLCTP